MPLRIISGRTKAIAAALAAITAAGCIVPSASAGDYRRRHYSHGSHGHHNYSSSYYAPRAYYYSDYDYERDRRRRERRSIAKAVAIGVGIAILGAALSHGRRYR